MASATLTRPTTQAVRAISNLVGGDPVSVTWRLDSEPNVAEIQIPKKRFHEFRQYSAGKPVWVKIRKNFVNKIVFHGWITSRFFDYSPDAENVSVICHGARWRLGADFIKGRHMLNSDGNYGILSGLKCIFNERLDNSQIEPGNAATNRIAQIGVRPFSLNPRDEDQTQSYNVNEMLWYSYYLGKHGKDPLPDVIGDVLTLTEFGVGALGELVIYDVNIDGLTVLSAFDTIMSRASLRWWCRPISTTQSQLRAFLAGPNADTPRKYVYLANVTSGVSPDNSPVLRNISTSTNNTEAGRMNEDFIDVANEVYGYGAPKIYQETFTLRPGWDSETWDALKVEDIATIRKELRESTSSDWDTYKNIGRLWILDEQGATTGTAHDFSTLFGGDEYAQIPRPFLGQRVDGEKMQTATALNPVSGEHEKLEGNIRILENQAGVYIEGDELAPPIMTEQNIANVTEGDSGTVAADPQLATEIKIISALKEDMALEASTTEFDAQERKKWLVGIIPNDDGLNSTIERRMPIVVDAEYQTDNINTDKETEVEDKLEDLVVRKREEMQDPRVSASFSIPWICTTYEPGDQIIAVRGRNLYFTAQVIEVRFEFGESQRTELVLEDMRLAEN